MISKKEGGHSKEARPKSRRETLRRSNAEVVEFIRRLGPYAKFIAQHLARRCQDVPGTCAEKRAESVHKEKP